MNIKALQYTGLAAFATGALAAVYGFAIMNPVIISSAAVILVCASVIWIEELRLKFIYLTNLTLVNAELERRGKKR